MLFLAGFSCAFQIFLAFSLNFATFFLSVFNVRYVFAVFRVISRVPSILGLLASLDFATMYYNFEILPFRFNWLYVAFIAQKFGGSEWQTIRKT